MSDTNSSWANPMPAGLISLAMACTIFYALLTGKVTPDGYGVVGFWLIGGFFVQMAVGLIELRMGSTGGGNTFLWFSGYFMLATGSVYLLEYFAHCYGWHVDPSIVEGWCWVGISIVMWLQYPAFLKTMPFVVAVLVTIMNTGAPFVAGMKLGLLDRAVFAPITGNMIGIVALLGFYSGAAIVNNTIYGRQILPFPGPIIKERSQGGIAKANVSDVMVSGTTQE